MIGGLPRTLAFLGLVGFTSSGTNIDSNIGVVGIGGLSHDFAQFIEECLPCNVRLLRIGTKYYTIWSARGTGTDDASMAVDFSSDCMEEERKPRIGSSSGRPSASSSTRGLSGAIVSATGKKKLEEWPERRAQMYMREWLEGLECEEAVWASDELECLG